jgi:hypothetical protein
MQIGLNGGGTASLAAPPTLEVKSAVAAGTLLHEIGHKLFIGHGTRVSTVDLTYENTNGELGGLKALIGRNDGYLSQVNLASEFTNGEFGGLVATTTTSTTSVNSGISVIDSTGKAYGFTTSGDVVIGGNVNIGGTLTKSTGSFKIDHPLDPANKYLYHSFVESPDMMNIYNGNATLDAGGEAIVQLPDYFEALNRDFRYQLSCIGSFAPVYVSEKVSHNQFKIAGGSPGMEVSWQVTGIRQDAYAKAHPIQVEVEKEAAAKGKYLSPKEHGMPESMGIGWKNTSREEPRLKNQSVKTERSE